MSVVTYQEIVKEMYYRASHFFIKSIISCIVLVCFCSFSFAQESVPQKVNVPGVVALGAITPIALGGVYVYMNHVWWSEKSTGFHFDDGSDLTYALNLDKLGHFTASCLVSAAFTDILTAFRVPRNTALWCGATMSVVNASVIEIKDGYAPFWGFSIYDEMANLLGAFYPVLQEKVPFFKNFNWKWSFDIDYSYETEYYKYKQAMKYNNDYSFIDDYDRQYFWLTIDWANMFFKNKKMYCLPYCVDFALGVSANDLKSLDANKEATREWFIGFDLNLTKFFQKKNWGCYACKYVNYYHLPMPAMELSPEQKMHVLMY